MDDTTLHEKLADAPSAGALYADGRSAFAEAFGPAGEVVAILLFVLIGSCLVAIGAMWWRLYQIQKTADARATADAEKIENSIRTMARVGELLPLVRSQRAEFLQELRYKIDASTKDLKEILQRMERKINAHTGRPLADDTPVNAQSEQARAGTPVTEQLEQDSDDKLV